MRANVHVYCYDYGRCHYGCAGEHRKCANTFRGLPDEAHARGVPSLTLTLYHYDTIVFVHCAWECACTFGYPVAAAVCARTSFFPSVLPLSSTAVHDFLSHVFQTATYTLPRTRSPWPFSCVVAARTDTLCGRPRCRASGTLASPQQLSGVSHSGRCRLRRRTGESLLARMRYETAALGCQRYRVIGTRWNLTVRAAHRTDTRLRSFCS